MGDSPGKKTVRVDEIRFATTKPQCLLRKLRLRLFQLWIA